MNLAERIEAATGPDRELDMAIFQFIGAPCPFQFMNKLIALEYNDQENAYFARVSDDMQVKYAPPAYTASIDAAMMLVPEGWCIASFEWWPMTSTKAGITLREVRENEWGIGFDQTCGDARSHAATPALALAAACLRAGGK